MIIPIKSIGSKSIYSIKSIQFTEKITLKKRLEIANLINKIIIRYKILDALDVGTTKETGYCDNIIVKNLKNVQKFKTISNVKINDPFFQIIIKNSITSEISEKNINKLKSDLVISNATIEHVGNLQHQIKMIQNIIRLTKKIFIISTPNRYFPIEFHTKIPLIHFLPKKIHRYLLRLFGFRFLSKEKNLNLLSEKDLLLIMNKFKNQIKYKIKSIKLFNIKSNLILIGKK
jgi:hypothetical protein